MGNQHTVSMGWGPSKPHSRFCRAPVLRGNRTLKQTFFGRFLRSRSLDGCHVRPCVCASVCPSVSFWVAFLVVFERKSYLETAVFWSFFGINFQLRATPVFQ